MVLLVPDDLWLAIGPLLPPERPKPKGGWPRALDGILSVLRTGIQWHEVPAELGCCGKPCWRRLGEWHAAGVWARLHRALRERLHDAGQLDWSRAALDSASLAAKKGGAEVGATPTDRGRPGTRRYLVTDARSTPLGIALSGANRHDSMMLVARLDTDKDYDHRRCRRECRARGINPRIARRGGTAAPTSGCTGGW